MCAETGLGGFFCRVVGGAGNSITEGSSWVRVNHPHTEWSIRRVSHLIYEGADLPNKRFKPPNNSRKTQMQELLTVKELGNYEWKDVLKMLTNDEYSERLAHEARQRNLKQFKLALRPKNSQAQGNDKMMWMVVGLFFIYAAWSVMGLVKVLKEAEARNSRPLPIPDWMRNFLG